MNVDARGVRVGGTVYVVAVAALQPTESELASETFRMLIDTLTFGTEDAPAPEPLVPSETLDDRRITLEQVAQAFENNQEHVELHWTTAYYFRPEVRSANRILLKFPSAFLTSRRVAGTWCWAPDRWSDHFTVTVPLAGCFSIYHPLFSVADIIRAPRQVQLMSGSVLMYRLMVGNPERMDRPNSQTCAASVEADLMVDRKTLHPIRLSGQVIGNGCNALNDGSAFGDRVGEGEWAQAPRKGSTFYYEWRRHESHMPDGQAAWILHTVMNGDPVWFGPAEQRRRLVRQNYMGRLFMLDPQMEPAENRYPFNSLVVAHFEADLVQELTADTKLKPYDEPKLRELVNSSISFGEVLDEGKGGRDVRDVLHPPAAGKKK
jgi:hypothetical protein